MTHTASAALDAAAKNRPELVLLDLYLPDASGLKVLGRLRALAEPPDVIVLSAAQDMASVRNAMRQGALHFLIKPFGLDTLQDRLERYAQLHTRRSVEREADQAEIDLLFGVMRQGREPAAGLPKGHAPATAELVVRALTEAGTPLSAAEVAERVGISRATAQRDISAMADRGTVQLRLRYGATGRPEHRYELEMSGVDRTLADTPALRRLDPPRRRAPG